MKKIVTTFFILFVAKIGFAQAGKDQKALLPQYIKLEKDPRYKDYPYLKNVIADMKKSVISYTDDDLQPCE
jgi:hypothetical protein